MRRMLFKTADFLIGLVISAIVLLIAAPLLLVEGIGSAWRSLVIKYHYDGDRDAYDRDRWRDN
jgi:hypothetical protein